MSTPGTKLKTFLWITGLTALLLLVYFPAQGALESDLQEFREMIIQRSYREEKGELLIPGNPRKVFHMRNENDPGEPGPEDVVINFFRSKDPILRKAVDLGESSLEILEQVLNHKNHYVALNAARCISIIGGEKAREILTRAARRDERYRPYLLSCLATTATGEDVFLLEKAVEEVIEGVKGSRSELSGRYAFNSLTLIRTEEAKAALSRFAAIEQTKQKEALRALEEAISRYYENDQTEAGDARGEINDLFRRLAEIDYNPIPDAAAHVISRNEAWAGSPPYDRSDMKSVLINEGIFNLSKGLQFYESCGEDGIEQPVTSQRIWSHENDMWVSRQVLHVPEDGKNVPSVCFMPYVAKNGKAAILDFSIYYGPLHAYVYWANLKKVGDAWKLVFYSMVWVS